MFGFREGQGSVEKVLEVINVGFFFCREIIKFLRFLGKVVFLLLEILGFLCKSMVSESFLGVTCSGFFFYYVVFQLFEVILKSFMVFWWDGVNGVGSVGLVFGRGNVGVGIFFRISFCLEFWRRCWERLRVEKNGNLRFQVFD